MSAIYLDGEQRDTLDGFVRHACWLLLTGRESPADLLDVLDRGPFLLRLQQAAESGLLTVADGQEMSSSLAQYTSEAADTVKGSRRHLEELRSGTAEELGHGVDAERLIDGAEQQLAADVDALTALEALQAAIAAGGPRAVLPLPAEEAGVLAAAIESHLLGLNLGTPFENEVGLSAGRLEVAKLERVVDRLAFYARTLRAVESRDLVLDVETLGLLDALAGDAVEQKALDAEGHPDDQAISAGREARLRGIREMAAHRVRLAQDGDA